MNISKTPPTNLSHAPLLTHVIEEEYRLKCENARQQRLETGEHPGAVDDGHLSLRAPAQAQQKEDPGPLRLHGLHARQAEHHLAGRHRLRQNRPGHQLSHSSHPAGSRGRYVLFADLLNELHRSQADRSQNQVIRRYVKYDLLLIDEIGYAEAEPSQVGLFFTLLQKRHKQSSTLITSNLGFSEWASFLKNPI